MPTPYEFTRADGTRFTVCFPMGECPSSFTCEDGTVARRAYGVPSVSTHSLRGAETDDSKIRREVKDRCSEIGIAELKPMKGQSPSEMLKDVRENTSKMSDMMSEERERSERRKAISAREKARENRMTEKKAERIIEKRKAEGKWN